ncbi:MAG TPA: Uma2 family endonuclease [Anaerolineae bacterium]|nr:Uma2 family endonuclease [Anaerolineae bacterium]
MSVQSVPTISRPKQSVHPRPVPSVRLPPLCAGDRLSRAEFERRYQAHPEIKKAELIEGVVYMPTPVRFEQHGRPHFNIITWLGTYCAATPGIVAGGDNAAVRLDFENEVQPDALLRLEPEVGGRSRVTEDDYLEGPPELVVEIATSSAAYDLHDKRRVYARSGVLEYLVVQMYEQRLDWFILREGVYETLTPDADGVLRSETFPGLWLQSSALWSGDLAAMLAVLREGLASPERVTFQARLQAQLEGARQA